MRIVWLPVYWGFGRWPSTTYRLVFDLGPIRLVVK